MTLREYVGRLPESHAARRELEKLAASLDLKPSESELRDEITRLHGRRRKVEVDAGRCVEKLRGDLERMTAMRDDARGAGGILMEQYTQRFTDDEYLSEDWFSGTKGDDDARCHSVSMVTTRKAHVCYGNGCEEHHEIPPGTRAIHETAIVDGAWSNCYLCVKHMDEWLDTYSGEAV